MGSTQSVDNFVGGMLQARPIRAEQKAQPVASLSHRKEQILGKSMC